MGTVDFSDEPAYWYEKTMRDTERAGLPVRHRPAINRDEKLIAGEVRRHLDRVVVARASAPPSPLTIKTRPGARICAMCGQRFSRRDWQARRLWRVVYPAATRAHGARVELYKHLICP